MTIAEMRTILKDLMEKEKGVLLINGKTFSTKKIEVVGSNMRLLLSDNEIAYTLEFYLYLDKYPKDNILLCDEGFKEMEEIEMKGGNIDELHR